jgi:hypothetical protein
MTDATDDEPPWMRTPYWQKYGAEIRKRQAALRERKQAPSGGGNMAGAFAEAQRAAAQHYAEKQR